MEQSQSQSFSAHAEGQRRRTGDEELRAVGVGASVGHREESRLGVLEGELKEGRGREKGAMRILPVRNPGEDERTHVLVGELGAVDRLSASSVVVGEVTALEHELGDDAVEARAGVAKAVLAGAELAEVTGRLGNDVVVELELDAAGGRAVDYRKARRVSMLRPGCGEVKGMRTGDVELQVGRSGDGVERKRKKESAAGLRGKLEERSAAERRVCCERETRETHVDVAEVAARRFSRSDQCWPSQARRAGEVGEMRTDSHLASTARKTWSGLLRDGLSKRRDSRHGEDAARAREEGRAEMGEQTASLRGLNGKERTTKGWLKSLWWMEVREERQQRRELGQQGVAQAEFKISRWASLAGGPAACSLRPNLSAQPLLLTLLSLSLLSTSNNGQHRGALPVRPRGRPPARRLGRRP